MERAIPLARFTRASLPLRLYFFASFAALGVYTPFFPRWLVARGIEGVAMGAVVACIPAMGVIGPPLVGIFADSLGLRGSLLRTACLGSFFAFVLLAVAGLLHHHLTFLEILAMVLVFAAFRAPMLTMADVVAVEREQDTGASYGTTRLFGSVGFLVASICGGRYLDPESPTALPALVAASLFLALVTAFAIRAEGSASRLPIADKIRSLVAGTDIPVLLGIAFVAELAISSYEICFSLHLADLGASSTFIGVAWAVGVVVEIAMMAAAGLLIGRFRAPRLIVFAICVVAVRCALLATVRSLPALLVIQLLHSPSVALLWIAALYHLKNRTRPETFATAQGLFSAVTAAGSVTGMLLWGGLYRRLGGRCTFGMAAVVAVAAALLAFHWRSRSRARDEGGACA